MRKRCKTCVHWDAEGGDTWGNCIKAGSHGEADDSTSLAVAWDFEGYQAHLQTAATFGCVQWKKKEKE